PQKPHARNAHLFSEMPARYTQGSSSYSPTVAPRVVAKRMRSKPLSTPCSIFRHCWLIFLRAFQGMPQEVPAMMMRQPQSRKWPGSLVPQLMLDYCGFLSLFSSLVYCSFIRSRIILDGFGLCSKT